MRKNILPLNRYFISRVLGFILCLESVFMFLAAALSFYYNERDAQFVLVSGVAALFFGAFFVGAGTKKKAKIVGKRESFMAVSLSWVAFSVFGMLPFYLSGAIPSVTDAFFETMSGLTTTGSSILTDVERLSKGLLFWRSLLQWLGGMGMIVFSLALLPLLGGGAVQLYDAETSGITHDRFRPRVAQIAKRLWGIYLSLTLILTGLLYVGPMNFFDALCHALTTVSTGGFSTRQASIAYWDSVYVETVVCIFMIIGSINFTLIYFLFQRSFARVSRDEELRWYLIIIAGTVLLLSFLPASHAGVCGYGDSFRKAAFQVVSVISTCGFVTSDFVAWGPFYCIVFLLLMVICGCAGSTSGGMKVIRIVVLAGNTKNEFKKHLHPKAILPVRINGTALSPDVVQRVMSFVFLYLTIIVVSWIFFCLTGMGFEESLGASVTAIGNVGPGLGSVGPGGDFSAIPVVSKWYMSFLMMVGRLEIFTVLTLFTPGFWKKM
jgi:trk system potassium uptake protein TrkH